MNTNPENKSYSLTLEKENNTERKKDSLKIIKKNIQISNKNTDENIKNSYFENEKKIKKIYEKINHNKISNMLNLERYVFIKFNNFYSNEEDFYNIKIINEIICNETTHIVALFKDNLINGDNSEFLQKSYYLKESKESLPKIFQYYDSCSVIFPNYVILPESKYIYKNIQRKQRVIDNQQDLESKLEKIKKGIIKIKEDDNPIFNTFELDSILDQTDTSGIRRFFGINKSESNLESKNISVENIIKRISNAEDFVKENNNISNNYINNNNSKIKNEKKKMNINFITISSSKGRNHIRNMDDSNNNNNKKDNNNIGINSNSSISKNTKFSSTTIDLENKNQNNILINNNSNTIYAVSNSLINNNNNSIKNNNINLSINNNNNQDVKKQNLINNVLINKNKEEIIKAYDEKNKNKSNHFNTQTINTSHTKKKIKTSKKNILPPADIKSNNKFQFNKISSSTNHIKTLSSSLSSPNKGLINNYHNKNNLSMSKIISPNIQSLNQKTILNSKNQDKKKENLIRTLNIRENIHFLNRENLNYEYMNILNSKIKKIKSFNKKNSSIPKKKFIQNYSYNNSNNKKEFQTINNESESSRQINYRNRNFNFNLTENLSIPLNSKFFSPEIKTKREISKSPKNTTEKKLIKNYSHFHSNSSYLGNNKYNNNDEKGKNKKIKNSVFPKQEINFKGFQIKGFKEFLQNNNKYNSRNSKGSNSERIFFNENNGNQSNRNVNFSSKTFMDVYATIHNRK